MLDERARVAEVVDVLPGRALAGAAALGDGVGAGLVERDAVALEDLGQVGADVVEVDLVVAAAGVVGDVGLLEQHEHVALVDGVAGLGRSAASIRPLAGALISCSIFMASITSTWRPATTSSPGAICRLTIVPCIGARMATVPVGRSASAVPLLDATGAGADLPSSRTASGSVESRRTPARPGASATSGTRPLGDLLGGVEQLAEVLVDEAGGRPSTSGSPGAAARPAGTAMFVAGPSMRNSPSAADARRAAAARSGLGVDATTLASSESKFGLVA